MPVNQAVKAIGGATTSAITTTSGATLLACFTGGNGGVYAPSDSKGNTWGSPVINVDSGGARLAVYVVQNATVGSGHTFQFSGAGGDTVGTFAEVTGVLAASLDSAATASGTGAGPFLVTAAATLAQAANTVVGFMLPYASGVLTYGVATGYTINVEETDNNNYYGVALASKSVSSTTAPTATFSMSTGGDILAGLLVLKESGGGASTTTATAAAGVATVSGVGSSNAATAGSAAGAATVSAVGAATTRTGGTAAGAATVSGAASSQAATAASAAVGVAVVSGVGASTAGTVATPAAGTSVVSGVGSSLTSGTTTAVPAAGVATVSAAASSVSATTAVPAAGTSSASATTPGGTAEEPQESYSAPSRKRRYNYDYSSPKVAEVVEPAKAPVKAVTKKAKKSIPPDMVEMLSLIEASQSVTAEVLSEQMAIRAAEQRQFEEEQEMMAVIACCL